MTTEKFSGTIENAYGKPLSKPVNFEGEYEAYENIDEIRAANDFPSNDDVVDYVNNKRKASARQKSMQAALEAAGYEKPTLETDEDLQIATIVKALLARKDKDGNAVHTKETATAAAKATLGIA